MKQGLGPLGLIRLLDHDVELAEGMTAIERSRLRESLIAESFKMRYGVHVGYRAMWTTSGTFDLILITHGAIGRRVQALDAIFLELLGEGDILSLDTSDGYEASDECLLVFEDVQFAILSPELLARACRWPSVQQSLLKRSVTRARRLSRQAAINNVIGVDRRLALSFTLLAERWGRMTSEGIALDLELTNEQLGQIVGSCQQSVSTALNLLIRRRYLSRREGGGWLISCDPAATDQPLGAFGRV